MWGITSRSRIQLRIFRNAFRGKSTKDRCDNFKENYGYYVSIKRRIRKRLRNIRNRLGNICNLFLIFENPLEFFFACFFCNFKEKQELDTLHQFPHTQTLHPNKQSTPQLSNLKRSPKHHQGIEPRSSCTAHFSRSSRPTFLLVENCIFL